MIDRPDESDFVAVYRDSNPRLYPRCFNGINWFRETIFPAGRGGKPPDFYPTDPDCQRRREKRYVAVSRPSTSRLASIYEWLPFEISQRTFNSQPVRVSRYSLRLAYTRDRYDGLSINNAVHLLWKRSKGLPCRLDIVLPRFTRSSLSLFVDEPATFRSANQIGRSLSFFKARAGTRLER